MQGNGIEDYFLIGGIAVIGLAEAAHLGAMLTGQSFSVCMILFGVLMLLAAAAAGLWFWGKHRKPKQETGKATAKKHRFEKLFWDEKSVMVLRLGFLAVVIWQLMLLVSGDKVYLGGDLTVETVESIRTTGSFYQVNPLTGQAYTLGVPLRLKILGLPTLYAIFCEVFQVSAEVLVWKITPVIVLTGSYLAYHLLAKVLWAEDAWARSLFLLVVALVFTFGDYMYGVDGFGVMRGAFRGVSIRAAILLPYTFGLCLRRKWKQTIWCILAEACIVWTLYGMGACLFVTAGMYGITWYMDRKKKEDVVCGNS